MNSVDAFIGCTFIIFVSAFTVSATTYELRALEQRWRGVDIIAVVDVGPIQLGVRQMGTVVS